MSTGLDKIVSCFGCKFFPLIDVCVHGSDITLKIAVDGFQVADTVAQDLIIGSKLIDLSTELIISVFLAYVDEPEVLILL